MRVWERGSGETAACGTGACAALVAAVLTDKTERRAIIHLNGGDLEIEWRAADNHVFMTGPAEEVFSGEIECDAPADRTSAAAQRPPHQFPPVRRFPW